MNKQIRKSF